MGAGINTIVNTLYLLITGIDWMNLGRKLAEGLNGLASEVHFVELGNLIGEKFMVLPRIVLGFVSDLNWWMVGAKIGSALNGVVSSIDLSQLGEMLGKGITGIFRSAINFSANFDWKALGTSIYQGINSFFSNTDWASVGQGISDFVIGLLDALIIAIDGTDWTAMGESIADMLMSIDWEGIGSRLYEAGKKLIDGLLAAFDELPEPVRNVIDFITEFFEVFATVGTIATVVSVIGQLAQAFSLLSTPFGQVMAIIGAIVYGFKYLYENSEIFRNFIDGIIEGAKNLIPGIIEGIKSGWESFKNFWIGIWESVVNWFKDLFGIHSPSTLMAEMGTYLMEGLINGIQSLVGTVLDVIQALWDGIKGVFEGFIEFFKGAFTGDWTAAWEGIKKIFSSVWESIKGIADTVINAIKKVISTALDIIESTWDVAWNGLKNTVVNVFTGIWNFLKGIINTILGGIEKLANGVINGINFVIGALNNLSFDLPDWLPGDLGGKTLGFNIPELSQVSIPRLATGAVIPANKEFLAVLGDQKHGTNIEAPLDTIKQATEESLLNVLSRIGMSGGNGGGTPVNLTLQVVLDKKVLGQTMVDWGKLQQMATGNNPYDLGTT